MMKKYLKVVILAVVIGGVLAYFFYKDIKTEVKAITSKEEKVFLFQVGVFKSFDNASKLREKYETSTIYKDGEYYRVIIGVVHSDDALAKLENIYKEKEINYYIKEMNLDKKMVKKINEYENVYLKTNNTDAINIVMKSILELFNTIYP